VATSKLRVEERLRAFERDLDDLAQIEPLALQHHLAGGDARHVEQVVDQLDQLLELALHHRAHARCLRRVGGHAVEHLQAGADRRQRVAQLVRQCGQELVLAAVCIPQRPLGLHPFGDLVADLELAAPRAQRGLHRAHHGARRRRPVEHRHVAERRQHAPRPRRRRIALGGQHQHRHVGPLGLLAERDQQRADVRIDQRVVGHQHGADAGVEAVGQLARAQARHGVDAGARQQLARDLGVAPRRHGDQHAFVGHRVSGHRPWAAAFRRRGRRR
jgi:hypothetical protein